VTQQRLCGKQMVRELELGREQLLSELASQRLLSLLRRRVELALELAQR
jgi:hypothetical protein